MSAKKFSFVVGLLYLVLGVSGVIPSLLSPAEAIPQIVSEVGVPQGFGNLYGIFPINSFEAAVYIVVGIGGLVGFAGTEAFARLYADTIAVWFALIGFLGFIPVANTLFGLMPIYGSDVFLHLGTAVVAAYFGFYLDQGRPDQDPSASGQLDPGPLERTPIRSDN